MHDMTFDRFAKGLAARLTRRGLIRGASGAAAGGGLAIAAASARAQDATPGARDDPEEQSVRLFEELADLTHDHVGTCAELVEKVRAFQTENDELIRQIRSEQSTWDRDHRAAHAETYGNRRRVAVAKIDAAKTQCQYARASDGTPIATPAATPSSYAGPLRKSPTNGGAPAPIAGSQACGDTVQALCTNPNTGWGSALFSASAICTDSTRTNCSLCVNDSYCASQYAGSCFSPSNPNVNECAVQYYCQTCGSQESCCAQNCPLSTGDCVGNGIDAVVGNARCGACMLSWCGSESSCLEHCESEVCCDDECSDAGEDPYAASAESGGGAGGGEEE